jgi:hypothetical protein
MRSRLSIQPLQSPVGPNIRPGISLVVPINAAERGTARELTN